MFWRAEVASLRMISIGAVGARVVAPATPCAWISRTSWSRMPIAWMVCERTTCRPRRATRMMYSYPSGRDHASFAL